MRRLAAAGLAIAVATVLVACATEEPTPTPGASASPSPSPSVSPSATPTESPAPEPDPVTPPAEATPIGISCQQLLTAEDIYNYNPNMALVEGQAPAAGTPGARAVSAGGIACAILNLSSNETIVVAASNPGPAALAAARAGSGAPAEGLGGEGWFAGGTATVIAGPYLVTATSPVFTAGADAAPLTVAAISHLG